MANIKLQKDPLSVVRSYRDLSSQANPAIEN